MWDFFLFYLGLVGALALGIVTIFVFFVPLVAVLIRLLEWAHNKVQR